MSELYIDGGAVCPDYLDGRDLVILGTDGAGRPRRLPGWCSIRGAVVAYKVDPRQVKGKSAARPTYSALDTSRTFTIEWIVRSESQRQIADSIRAEILPNRVYASAHRIEPMAIQSAQLDSMDITHVTIEGGTAWESSEPMIDRCTLTVRPWYPAEKTARRPAGKTTATQTPAVVTNVLADAAAAAANPRPSSKPGAAGP
jgi:hypothetical protein